MICSKCGSDVPNDCKFCFNCGSKVEASDSSSAVSSKEVTPAIQTPSSQSTLPSASVTPTSYGNVFIEPDEQLLSTLGNGYVENILNKKVKKCHALLTDKRVYFQGTFFSGSGKSFIKEKYEKIVDLEDITGTGFRYSNPFGLLAPIVTIVVSWFLALLYFAFDLDLFFPADNAPIIGLTGTAIAILILIVNYLKSRGTDFIIEYAGGHIRFNASIIGLSKVQDFQKQIRRAKDKVKGNI